MIINATFPSSLKLAEVSPVFKKDDKFDKANYRPISLLPVFSKIFERIIYNQLEIFFQDSFSVFLCGFRSKHSTQHALLRLLSEWKKSLDNRGKVGTILIDLSKAFDTLDHDLLIAKLSAYGLNFHSLRLMKNYLNYQKGQELNLATMAG